MKLPTYFNRTLTLLTRKLSLICLACVGLMLFSCEEKGNYKQIIAPVEFSSKIPVDVDPALQKILKEEGKVYELNEAFNMYSWQAFMAIQWPENEKGEPMPNFTDQGEPAWLRWKEAFQVYRFDGQKPAPWGSPREASGLGFHSDQLNDIGSRIVLSSKTPTHPENFNIADETEQAFAGKLFDQNGNVVVYEVLMNEVEFDYVVENNLYNKNGQMAYSSTGAIANFPAGDYDLNYLGAVEIKFAWKILEDTDFKERYYRDEGYIEVIKDGKTTLSKNPVHLGLIGMHISQKTPTGKQWVWSTFEHIDNLDQNVFERDGKRSLIHPTLRDPDCEICPVNIDVSHGTTYKYIQDKQGDYWQLTANLKNKDSIYPEHYYASDTVMKTQAFRMVDIPMRVRKINSKMQAYFAQQESVWQYYQLIDTQYPLDQNIVPAPNDTLTNTVPQSVVNKSGGIPNISLLTNITMETFFQGGNQSASHLIEGNPPNPTKIYGTESCIGCHSSAGLNRQVGDSLYGGDQLSGDFSWLLGKAQWNKNKDSIPMKK